MKIIETKDELKIKFNEVDLNAFKSYQEEAYSNMGFYNIFDFIKEKLEGKDFNVNLIPASRKIALIVINILKSDIFYQLKIDINNDITEEYIFQHIN